MCPKSQSGAIKSILKGCLPHQLVSGCLSSTVECTPKKSLIYSYPQWDFFHQLLQDIFYVYQTKNVFSAGNPDP